MIIKGFSPTLLSYNTLMNDFCINDQLQEASGFVNEMIWNNIVPHVCTYNVLINSLIWKEEKEKRRNVWYHVRSGF